MNNKSLVFKLVKFEDGDYTKLLVLESGKEVLDRAVGVTLLEFIEQHSTSEKEDAEFEALLQKVERGEYTPDDPRFADWDMNAKQIPIEFMSHSLKRFADWDMNAKQIWLCPPVAKQGHMAITNEYTEYSIDPDSGGEPQQFTFDQYRKVLKFWRDCQKMVEGKDLSTMEDFRQEIPFPEA